MHWRLVGVLLALALSGCQSYSSFLLATSDYLEARQSRACLFFEPQGGGGLGPTINGRVRGFVATGGIDPALCKEE